MTAGTPLTPSAVQVEQDRFRQNLATASREFFSTQRTVLGSIAQDSIGLVDAIEDLTTGGKKLRPLLCYWGWRGAGGADDDAGIITAGMALELFQAAALIHDDIIDRSDFRRGAPSVHRRFEARHIDGGWRLDPERFGAAAAILAGDLCLSLSEEAFAGIPGVPGGAGRARSIFNLMRTEVMAGQYLDLLEEAVGPAREAGDAVERALTIVRFKSAKYSTEHPLRIGGALAGAPESVLAGYSAFALPLGEAFQLRDDLLGVYGDPEMTGKPAGDDLREGKRTVLIAKALQHCDPADRAALNTGLGRSGLTDAEVVTLRTIIDRSGARDEVEALIAERAAASSSALDSLDLDPLCREALSSLATAAIVRVS
ncbi:geranylgeranyl diphosphate synthase type I [Arthrobacter pigmenti]|uniref:Geranylgeranyl diphosphate synthase type I n=1 Tax=Arthrobacter pigmenti TaxID=271432 RepID=A0A846RNZ3_9MICC|nr:polyprenyl synthetase family protein [Arthrobacter pigmenti]NJC22074.1 geranylgeranyl diphosphate synthase type I [Arthrobacter pigmenti]